MAEMRGVLSINIQRWRLTTVMRSAFHTTCHVLVLIFWRLERALSMMSLQTGTLTTFGRMHVCEAGTRIFVCVDLDGNKEIF
jgi:hypothetical protein